MQIDRRFADYGFTGGFFLIGQTIMFLAIGDWPNIIADLRGLSKLMPPDTALTGPLITGFAGALVLISVFVVGLLLDLLATLFRTWEMRVFSHHLELNSDWITKLVNDNNEYCAADYKEFEGAFIKAPLGKFYLAMFQFWKPDKQRFIAAAYKVGLGWRLGRPYERLWSFFTSYVSAVPESPQLTLLIDRYALWRAARGIATALYIMSLEIMGWFLLAAIKSRETVPRGIISLGVPLALILSASLILTTYSRFCFTLFSLVYVAYSRQNSTVQQPKPAS